MELILLVVFVLGYLGITLEHPIKVDKAASALITAALCWVVVATIRPETSFASRPEFLEFAGKYPDMSGSDLIGKFVTHELEHHLMEAAQILFFLLGAMTIVELIDLHQGFDSITQKITTRHPVKLLAIVSGLAFSLSPILDNLTSTIVILSVLRRLIGPGQQRLLFAGMVVIAANAGGAWSPMGDVTTTMLWLGGQVSIGGLLSHVTIPAVLAMGVPLLLVMWRLPKDTLPEPLVAKVEEEHRTVPESEQRTMLFVGIGGLLSVPIFKIVTGLPPYLGMILALGIVWLTSEVLHYEKEPKVRRQFSAAAALQRVDTASVLFFLGILLAVGALQTAHILQNLADLMQAAIPSLWTQAYIIGTVSAIVDNVPIVAAATGMYDMATHGQDSILWQMIAYTAGTGGSMLIIGSAAGVAAMSIERIEFGWYLKNIGWLALLGYTAGAAWFLVYHY